SADAAQPGGADSADDRGRALDKPSSRGLVHRLGSEVDDLQKISRLLCRTRPLPNVRFQGLDRSPLVAAAADSTSRRSVRRKCALVRLSGSGLYHEPAPQGELGLMRLIDDQHTACPFYASRRVTAWLTRQGEAVHRKRGQRLRAAEWWHRVYPYLL